MGLAMREGYILVSDHVLKKLNDKYFFLLIILTNTIKSLQHRCFINCLAAIKKLLSRCSTYRNLACFG
jgi:hypothetical protein